MLLLWPIWFNPKLTNCLETYNPNPWLTHLVETISKSVDPSTSWLQLLKQSTHILWLVNASQSWHIDPAKVKQYVNHQPLIVNMAGDPFRCWEQQIVKELAQYTDNFIVLSSDVKYYRTPTDNICYIPFWYLHQKYNYKPVAVIDQPRQYRLSCLNRVSRYHRIENFIKLKRKPYFDQLLFTMLYEYDRQATRRETSPRFYNKQIVAEFESLIPAERPNTQFDGHSIGLPGFYDSYINFATETSVYPDTIFISEKTWKPFMSGQLGIWLSNPGTVAFLRDIGLDVFDDILYNHTYDQELDLNTRIDQLHWLIDQIMTMDIDAVWCDTSPRRQANIDLLYGKELETLLTQQSKTYENKLSII